ncbi:MAG: type II toxin-antitoxin system RelE/ParE family toxin [Sulfurospirillaceae bacterium]|nr:type II toxin-antitoxin system RelE/ParE family toxin [Sulfurospirillaceae bacterium]MDD3462571.1 type II toxin-antitoxin system RelE/ParE family toxin [Sulfurospirillaceae bacterium]
MKWKLKFAQSVKQDLKKINPVDTEMIFKSLEQFEQNFDEAYEKELISSSKIKKLKGEWEGFFRLRLRSYRVIYEKIGDEVIILVVRVAHRQGVYK